MVEDEGQEAWQPGKPVRLPAISIYVTKRPPSVDPHNHNSGTSATRHLIENFYFKADIHCARQVIPVLQLKVNPPARALTRGSTGADDTEQG